MSSTCDVVLLTANLLPALKHDYTLFCLMNINLKESRTLHYYVKEIITLVITDGLYHSAGVLLLIC